MLFMTCRAAGYTYQQMLKRQSEFGLFRNPKQPERLWATVSQWQNWCCDNGAFGGFDEGKFIKFLAYENHLCNQKSCLFVVAPDVPFDWSGTLEKFPLWEKRLHSWGYPVAVAAQDGATIDNIPWDSIECLFIGGSTDWKRSTGDYLNNPVVPGLITEAKKRGKWVHMGRQANSRKQLFNAFQWGADSVDGTCEIYMPFFQWDNWISCTMANIQGIQWQLSLLDN